MSRKRTGNEFKLLQSSLQQRIDREQRLLTNTRTELRAKLDSVMDLLESGSLCDNDVLDQRITVVQRIGLGLRTLEFARRNLSRYNIDLETLLKSKKSKKSPKRGGR